FLPQSILSPNVGQINHSTSSCFPAPLQHVLAKSASGSNIFIDSVVATGSDGSSQRRTYKRESVTSPLCTAGRPKLSVSSTQLPTLHPKHIRLDVPHIAPITVSSSCINTSSTGRSAPASSTAPVLPSVINGRCSSGEATEFPTSSTLATSSYVPTVMSRAPAQLMTARPIDEQTYCAPGVNPTSTTGSSCLQPSSSTANQFGSTILPKRQTFTSFLQTADLDTNSPASDSSTHADHSRPRAIFCGTNSAVSISIGNLALGNAGPSGSINRLSKVKSTAELVQAAGDCIDSVTADRILTNRITKEPDLPSMVATMPSLVRSRGQRPHVGSVANLVNPMNAVRRTSSMGTRGLGTEDGALQGHGPTSVSESGSSNSQITAAKSEMMAKFLASTALHHHQQHQQQLGRVGSISRVSDEPTFPQPGSSSRPSTRPTSVPVSHSPLPQHEDSSKQAQPSSHWPATPALNKPLAVDESTGHEKEEDDDDEVDVLDSEGIHLPPPKQQKQRLFHQQQPCLNQIKQQQQKKHDSKRKRKKRRKHIHSHESAGGESDDEDFSSNDGQRHRHRRHRRRRSSTHPPVTNLMDEWPVLPQLPAFIDWHSLSPEQMECEDSQQAILGQKNYSPEELSLSLTDLYSVPLGDRFLHILPWVDVYGNKRTFFPDSAIEDMDRLIDLPDPW
ncbi:unnamed protein product, partial [Protopolystoma xenopodis]